MSITIKAKCFNGQSYDLTFDSAAPTVNDLQSSISSASGITPDRQTILFKGQVLEPGSTISDYSLADGHTISVVRRIGKSAPKSSTKPPPASKPLAAPPSSATPANSDLAADPSAPQPPSLEDMMRSLNMGAGAAPPLGGGAAGVPPMPDLSALLGGADPSTLGAAGGAAAGGAGGLEQLFAQLPQMMNGFFNTPMLQDYLNDPEKQEQSRDAILNNPYMKKLLESDPEFKKVVSDPSKWRDSMDAAKKLFKVSEKQADDDADGDNASRSLGAAASKLSTSTRKTAADMAPPGISINKLSESYGHALGQSLINSGLGLDPELVVKGLKSAVEGKAFPMSLPDYERSMATMQTIASEFLTKANLEDADNFFEEIKQSSDVVVLEEGKIAYEKGDEAVDTSLPAAEQKSTVLIIVTARLLDGRHFFTCPAADESGESVHPLTLELESAPGALAKGIVGMHENESRLLYVHPTACDGMSDMFGDLLPPNALLIFDLQLVSANAPEEDNVGEAYYNKAS
ncbi:Peptidyl-prolyl cis-trans isomerase Mip [Gracilariopsis chorda]|uniref:peptidylprolyl isomerase n=1 Tax=Gracilariopsis chorda TaxID=448386 RepID=A0A2V3IQY5_9FLOR|nr:Peptidyl-prolyl cis-trans isomerase Mip [Gracilariopsis chorda]|eukprot:PXF44535.1 Peptidyl-prolyl cis-trans isomerase Mip [Gracilariopsis chorda]